MSGFAGFDFENATPVDAFLPAGEHVVMIQNATANDSKGGYPQIELEVENQHGSRRDWLVYNSEFGARKVYTAFLAAGVKLGEGDVVNGVLKDEVVKKIVGKKVGVTVAEEPDQTGQPRLRITRYVDPKMVEVRRQQPGRQQPVAAGHSSISDDDIPF